MPRSLLTLAATLGFALPIHAQHEACRASSGAQVVPLIELYTSEGCSSCPPADRWLAERAAQVAKSQVNVLSWHVDYWDSLGWSDPFANAQATERQRWQAQKAGAQVYTPGVFLNGREWRAWYRDALPTPVAAGARLSLSAQKQADAIGVQLAANGIWPDGAELRTVLYERKLRSAVTRGENAGKALNHDFVVRSTRVNALAAGDAHFDLEFAAPAQKDFSKLGLVALLQDRASGEVLQSLNLPLAGCVTGL